MANVQAARKRQNDLVILGGKKPRALVMKIVGDYQFVAGESLLEGDYQNQRCVEITAIDGNSLWLAAEKAPGKHSYQTSIRTAHSLNESELGALK